MKIKRILWILLLVIILIQFIDYHLPDTAVSGEKDIASVENVPSDVKVLMKNACYDCHSMETVYPWYSHIAPVKWLVKNDISEGRHHVNFSMWGNYTELEKVKKLDDIHDEVEKGEMPPTNYKMMHAKARLTDSDRQKIVAWADSSANKYLQ